MMIERLKIEIVRAAIDAAIQTCDDKIVEIDLMISGALQAGLSDSDYATRMMEEKEQILKLSAEAVSVIREVWSDYRFS